MNEEELEKERKKREELEKKLNESEEQLKRQYQLMMKIEQGLVSKEEAVNLLEKERMDSLTYHLAKEHHRRLEAEKIFDEEKKKYEEEIRNRDVEITTKDMLIEELKKKLNSMENELENRHKASIEMEAREWDRIVDSSWKDGELGLRTGEESWIRDTRDLIKVLIRLGKINVSVASNMLDAKREDIMNWAGILEKRGLVRVENPKSKDPTLRTTRKLVRKINLLRTKMRKRGAL